LKPFYINVTQDYGKILVTYVDEHGMKRREKREFFPTLYLRTQQNITDNRVLDEKEYYTVRGERVYPISIGDMKETREFIKSHENIDNFEIYGLKNYPYEFIAETFPGDVSQDWNESLINIAYMDIEVRSDDGFPEPIHANKEITAITIADNSGVRVYGCGDYTHPIPNGKYYQCKSEAHMLDAFLRDWKGNYPDVISGWNVKTFDLTYLINRLTRILGEKFACQLSPWGKIRPVSRTFNGREETWYDISGIATLDLLELYRKYGPPGQKESYSLNYISHLELKEKKLAYSEYGSLHELYVQDYEKFIDYNIKDTLLVKAIEEKRRLIKLAMILAYDSKVNFEDVFYQTRMWDSLIFNHLKEQNIVPSPNIRESKNDAYEGAYVKDPQVGKHDWVVSFDYTSLYPSLMMQFNISPDTIVEPEEYPDDIREFISKHTINPEYLLNAPDLPDFAKHRMVLAANGQLFHTDKEGFLPTILRKMFADRQRYKKLYIEAKKEVERLRHDGKDATNAEQRVAMYDLLQLCKKVCLNSCYGATGTPYFRYYDIRQAVAVTLSGQFAIKYMEKKLNNYFRGVSSKKEKDYVLAVDTDSVYLVLDDFVDTINKGRDKSDSEIVGFLDKVCEKVITPEIKKYNKALAKYVGSTTVDLDMKRESICNKAIWTSKKRYILSVMDQEGVRYETPDIKMSGIEAVKSSTPEVCRSKIKDAIKIIMTGNESDMHKFIETFRAEFKKLPPEAIAFPRGINGLGEYANASTIYSKGSPIHVKGALIYNHLLHKKGLEKVYPLIKEGEKIKFLYMKDPNPLGITVISFLNGIPKEFVDILPYIDYNTQFEKTFIDPISIILNTIGWTTEPVSSLGAFWT
jgi:DNA polymerase elongation subunit (family B)